MIAPVLVACAVLAGQVPQDAPAPHTSPTGTAIVRGHVVAADTGRPIPYAQVMLAPDLSELSSDEQSAERMRIGRSSADGSFEFRALPAGSYMLIAEPSDDAGRNYLPAPYGSDEQPLGAPIQLAGGQVFDGATIRLHRGGVITGRVVDEFGQPLAHVTVRPLSYSHGAVDIAGDAAVTDDRGAFRVYGLHEGDWTVRASVDDLAPGVTSTHAGAAAEPPRPAGFLDTYYPNAAKAGAAQPVSLARGQEVDDLLIQMRYGRLYKIAGVAFDPAGRPFGHARVELTLHRDRGQQGTDQMEADASGRFTFTNLGAGQYTISVTNALSGEDAPSRPQLFGVGRADITVVDRDLTDLAIATTSGADVTGEVQFEPAIPVDVQALTVAAESPDAATIPAMGRANVDPQGRLTFTLQHLVGPQHIRLWEFRPGWYIRSILVNGLESPDPSREFHSGDRIVIIVSTRAATISGHVTKPNGEPAARCVVFLLSSDKTWDTKFGERPVFTSADGVYTFADVTPGPYYVAALDPAVGLPMADSPDALLQALAADAVAVSATEGERVVIDLKVKDRQPQ